MANDAGEQSPYRQERPLTDVIPPDRRRRAAIALASASLLSGVLWFRFAEDTHALLRESHPTVVTGPRAVPSATDRRLEPVTLLGLSRSVTLPLPTGAIVNVWLQGCSDCMPAFDAWAALPSYRSFSGVPIVNVAYGQADAAWAERYGVAENLVFDRTGSAIVQPLAIGSFTTLVVDSDGTVLLVDRPDRPGFVERVEAAIARIRPLPHPSPPPVADPPARDFTAFDRGAAAAALGAVNVASCKGPNGPTGSGHVSITFSPDGSVASVLVDQPPFAGTTVGGCVAKRFRSARIPAFSGGSVRVGKSFVIN